MTRLLLPLLLVLWTGATLLLAELRAVRRPSLVERLRPYASAVDGARRSAGVLSVTSFAEVVGPLARSAGDRLARTLGGTEDVGRRLERLRSPLTVTAFRTRQAVWSLAGLGLAGLLVLGLVLPLVPASILVVGLPLLAFLIIEQHLATASADQQRRLFLELPVVSEQLGMLLSAGYSLGAALNRLAVRSNGVVADDLAHVCGRIRQGLSDIDALREWARLADVVALDRLVSVLALDREAGDLGRLISEEARSVRADAHRELLEIIERRSEQVWVPVTVATLVPGILFLAVPFVEALRLFTAP